MPNRIIRSSILNSDSYVALENDSARVLFYHLMLLADDLGNVDGGETYLRRNAFVEPVTVTIMSRLLEQLQDKDLIRIYMVESRRYIHIPRFRQRLRYTKRACPRPPESIECTEIKDLLAKKTVYSPSTDRLPPDLSAPEVEEKRSQGIASHIIDSNVNKVITVIWPNPDAAVSDGDDEGDLPF